MANANGTKTIQISEELAKELSLLAIKENKTRKQIADEAIQYYLRNNGLNQNVDSWDQLT